MGKVECKICGHKAHILATHITKEHDMSLDDYQKEHGAFMSEAAINYLKEKTVEANNEKKDVSILDKFGTKISVTKHKTWAWEHPHKTTPDVDTDYVFRPDLLALMVACHENNGDRLLLTGPTGSGKSTCVIQAAARLNVPFYRVNLDNEVTKADFVGQYVLKGDETSYHYGVLPRAMKEGAWLLVDEWDMGNPGVTAVLQAVLEGNPLLIGDTGEIVQPHDGFRIFATGNTVGQGDETGLYSGTQIQNFAQLDRFTMAEHVSYPDEKIESEIIRKQCNLDDETLKKTFGISEIAKKDNSEAIIKRMVEVATLVRTAFVKEECTTTMSTRTLVNIGKKLLMFGDIKRAYEVSYLNKLNKEDRVYIEELIQRVWGI